MLLGLMWWCSLQYRLFIAPPTLHRIVPNIFSYKLKYFLLGIFNIFLTYSLSHHHLKSKKLYKICNCWLVSILLELYTGQLDLSADTTRSSFPSTDWNASYLTWFFKNGLGREDQETSYHTRHNLCLNRLKEPDRCFFHP